MGVHAAAEWTNSASDHAKDEDEDAHLRTSRILQDFENSDTLTDEEREGARTE